MHPALCRTLLPGRSALQACRFVAGRRFTVPASRTFRSSPRALDSTRDDSVDDISTKVASSTVFPEPIDSTTNRDAEDFTDQNKSVQEPGENEASATSGSQDLSLGRNGKGPYGSAKRRMRRNLSQRAESVITAPPHYLQKNIRLHQPATEGESIHTEINGGNASGRPDEEIYPNATIGNGAYQINRDVLFEVQASVNAGLRPTWAGEADSLAASKPHIVLQSPKDGGSTFLDAVVENAAKRCGADVIHLDAQDIAEFVADSNAVESTSYKNASIQTLGYETYVVPSSEQAKDAEEDGSEGEGWDEVDYEAQSAERPAMGGAGKRGSFFASQPMVISSVSGNINDIFKSLGVKMGGPGAKPDSQPQTSESSDMRPLGVITDQSLIGKFVESLINETDAQRHARAHKTPTEDNGKDITSEASETPPEAASSAASVSNPSGRGTILHIKDYLEIYSTAAGGSVLRSIHDLVLRRRKGGQRLLLLGTSSSEDLLPTYTKDGWEDVQNEQTSGPYRTIIVPCTSPEVDDIFQNDESIRTREINVRHLQDMIKRLTFDPANTLNVCGLDSIQLQTSSVFAAGFSEEVWSFEHVQRLANTALGLLRRGEEMTAEHIEWAMNMISASDVAKGDWLTKDKQHRATTTAKAAADSNEAQEQQLKKLRKQCNKHEKKLLSGVIDPANINTTFSDVRVAPATVDALHNLTSLSLTRPEAFTYGVLAAEKIPGLLLYGPPGTGKTLLAKAVAKESGATVLEVSGSDVYDMYVGEGEKNVRAIFSLAKKISPCVVFIDEADAIFGQRNNSGSRTSHREIINQFLREWDGMNEKSAFIMVATNRPFDLDDAVLRRLPRRLLVDLPTEKDREAILKIHLKDEQLAEDVDLFRLSQKTPFYSGSDLKNVCVSAALACVREEVDNAAAETKSRAARTDTNSTNEASTAAAETSSDSTESAQPVERRTLRNEHFEKALAEISASISDDMSSLTAIRRFDEKYGDRKGRRKRAGGPGFGTLTESEREKLEDGRVRTEQQAS